MHNFVTPTPSRIVIDGRRHGTFQPVHASVRRRACRLCLIHQSLLAAGDPAIAERKALFGLAETEQLTQAAYTPEVTQRVYAALADKAARVIRAGHSAIADAVFATAKERAAIAQAAPAAFRGLFLTADLATRLARVGGRRHDASDADAAVARAQEQYDLGPLDWTLIDASGSPEDTLHRVCTALGLS